MERERERERERDKARDRERGRESATERGVEREKWRQTNELTSASNKEFNTGSLYWDCIDEVLKRQTKFQYMHTHTHTHTHTQMSIDIDIHSIKITAITHFKMTLLDVNNRIIKTGRQTDIQCTHRLINRQTDRQTEISNLMISVQ